MHYKEKSGKLIAMFKSPAAALLCVNEILEAFKNNLNDADAMDIIYWERVYNEIKSRT